MITYPVQFEAQAETNPGMAFAWNSLASTHQTVCSIPKEFDGPGGELSPEDFFLLSIQNCFIGTFKVFAEFSRLTFENLEVKSKLVVNKDVSGKPWMESIHMHISLSGVKDEKKLQLLINKTFENGFILRSVKTQITHELTLS